MNEREDFNELVERLNDEHRQRFEKNAEARRLLRAFLKEVREPPVDLPTYKVDGVLRREDRPHFLEKGIPGRPILLDDFYRDKDWRNKAPRKGLSTFRQDTVRVLAPDGLCLHCGRKPKSIRAWVIMSAVDLPDRILALPQVQKYGIAAICLSCRKGVLKDAELDPRVLRSGKYQNAVEIARRARQAALDYIVPDRRCPHCKELKIDSRQWVLFTRGDFGPWVIEDEMPCARDIQAAGKMGLIAVCLTCRKKRLTSVKRGEDGNINVLRMSRQILKRVYTPSVTVQLAALLHEMNRDEPWLKTDVPAIPPEPVTFSPEEEKKLVEDALKRLEPS